MFGLRLRSTAASIVLLAAALTATTAAPAAASCASLGFQTTDATPGLAGYGGKLWLSWTGTNLVEGGNLNFISFDGSCFGTKFKSPQTASHGVALASFNGRLYAAWTGTDSTGHLNVMSSTDGVNWTSPTTLSDTSPTTPAMVAFKGQLWLAWTGSDHVSQGFGHINLKSSSDGVHWSATQTLSDTTPALDGPGLTQFTDPAGNFLQLAWTGTNNPSTIWAFQSASGTSWFDHTNTGLSGIAPALAPAIHHPLVMSTLNPSNGILLYTSLDGVQFSSFSSLGVGGIAGQALATFNSNVWEAYTTGTSQANDQLGLVSFPSA